MIENLSKKIIDNIKILIYKENLALLKKVNFDTDEIFLEPLIFSYFNSKKNYSFPKETLEEILQGYFIKKEKTQIEHSFNKKGIAYIPQVGYFKRGIKKPLMPIEFIEGTSIEVLKHSHPLIEITIKKAIHTEIKDSEVIICEELFNCNISFLNNAFHFIKTTSVAHFNLIEQCCKKIVLFMTNPNNTNSFATINAHGIAFLNVYQKDYDEVFFVDDIAHQTGHIILTTILFKRKEYFIIDENQNIGVITNKSSDYRSFYILFHALYTYYTSLLCLDNCIEAKCFNSRQIHEAKGRVGFYINKLILDMDNFIKIIEHFKGIEFVLTKNGIEIYNIMKDKFNEIITKWYSKIKNYDYTNQPYNFTYKEFKKINSIIDA